MTEIVAGDIGGTHARFCIAEVTGGRVNRLGPPVVLRTHEHASLAAAWVAFAATQPRPLPRMAAFAVACPVEGEVLRLTNNPWTIRPAALKAELGLDVLVLINDFAAIGHALSQLGPEDYVHLAGPEMALPEEGVITVLGPGTGLGVAHVLRRGGQAHVIASEGGHVHFAPLDAREDALLATLRARFGRVSAERVVSGPGLMNIYTSLCGMEARAARISEDAALWAAAIAGEDKQAAAALEQFCNALGAVAGDLALAHGASGVVIASGLVARIAHLLPKFDFAGRFAAKGRFEGLMLGMPVKLITHAQPGLLGVISALNATLD